MGNQNGRVGVLFVCMGNICRSPTAQGVFTHLAGERGFQDRLRIDSAGTTDYHTGEAPDPRAQAAALRHGIDIGSLRARQVRDRDYEDFHYVLAMDGDNFAYLRQQCPNQYRERVRLFLDFAPDAPAREVPDPYYGGAGGFDKVFALCRAASDGLLAHIEEHQLS